ncbi:MAG: endolytic transglycosylase MltG [Clostridiales bacterium]|nr:endolytic transglycosylase MltG [Clostridiales bacterium]
MSDHFKNFDELFRDERDSSRPQRPAQQRPAAAQPARRRPAQPRPVQPEGQRPVRPVQPRPVQPEGQRPARPAQSHPVQPRPVQPEGQRPAHPARPDAQRHTAARPHAVQPEGQQRPVRPRPAQLHAQPRPEQTQDLHAERPQQPQRPVRPRPEGRQTHAVRPQPVSRPAPETRAQTDPAERPARPAEPEVQRRAGRSGCLGGLIYFAFVVSISIILACVGWMAASDVLALNKEPVTATVTLDKAEFKDVTISYTDAEGNAKERSGHQVSVGYVAKQLKDAGIIKYKGLFELYCSVSHAKTKIDPGTYELSTNYDYRALVKKMQVGSGAMVTTKVTIPEGYTMEQIFHKLEDENVCSYDDLMDAAANYSYNYSFIDQSMQGDAKRLEGFLFPDTYEFYQGMQASSAINKFLENFHDRITAEMLEKADERSMTMQEVVTVASMIEKEAANDDERAMIAAVIYNRIAAGMPLQIDSTIMYVLPEHKDVLTVEDTKIDSPYNTYQNKGLPPTPIANPGLASIKATLSPASTQALYYALDAESGTHKFFTSYGEFQAFVAKQSYSQ